LNSQVLVFREGNEWKGPFRLLSIQDETMIIDLSNNSTKFRSTSIKSYYQNENNHLDDLSSNQPSDQSDTSQNLESSH
jgi:hypothetical protein